MLARETAKVGQPAGKSTRSARDVLNWWRAPFWLLALATGAKSFADNPILGSRRLNRRGLHAARFKLAHRLADRRRRRLAAAVPTELRAHFDRDGFVEIRDFLPADQFARLSDALLTAPLNARHQQQGDTVTRRVPIGAELLRQVPELKQLLDAPRWRSLLAYVASSSSAPFYYVQTIATGFAQGGADPQLELHADTFHPSLKAWLFLTDVDGDHGPLTYVAGSHRLTPQRLAWEQARSIAIHDSDGLSRRGSLRVLPEELSALGLPQPTRFAVPANTLVAIDTCGFHARGSSAGQSVRAEIWAFSRRTPFLPWPGFDPLSWGALALTRSDLAIRLVDRLESLGLARQPWPPAGPRRPIDP